MDIAFCCYETVTRRLRDDQELAEGVVAESSRWLSPTRTWNFAHGVTVITHAVITDVVITDGVVTVADFAHGAITDAESSLMRSHH